MTIITKEGSKRVGIALPNIYKCNGYGRLIIAEEAESHICKTPGSYRWDNDALWVSDEEHWYPLRPRHHFGNTTEEHHGNQQCSKLYTKPLR